MKTEQPKNWT